MNVPRFGGAVNVNTPDPFAEAMAKANIGVDSKWDCSRRGTETAGAELAPTPDALPKPAEVELAWSSSKSLARLFLLPSTCDTSASERDHKNEFSKQSEFQVCTSTSKTMSPCLGASTLKVIACCWIGCRAVIKLHYNVLVLSAVSPTNNC